MKTVSMRFIFTGILFLFVLGNSFAQEKNNLTFEIYPFNDTLVVGFDNEFTIQIEDKSNLNVTATFCSVIVKSAENGIYLVKVPATSVGKTSIIKIYGTNKAGKQELVSEMKIPIVAMDEKMRKRYSQLIIKNKNR